MLRIQYKKWSLYIFCITIISVMAGCATSESPSNKPSSTQPTETEISGSDAKQEKQTDTRTIRYLGNSYTVPNNLSRILLLNAFESLEDAVLLGYEPYAASAIGDDEDPFPGFFGTVTANTIPLLSESEDSLEYVLDLAPDLILSTDMETAKVLEQLNKIAPTIPTSHLGPDWRDNLELLAELIGEQEKAQQLISDYEQSKARVKEQLPALQDKDIMAIRMRGGEMMVYPKHLFLNDVLYGEAGLPVTELINKIDQQTVISLEGLFAADPDYLFLQFDLYENNNDEKLLSDLLENPIWKGLKAAKNEHVFVNAVDPLLMGGGTAYGRMSILKAIEEKLR